MMDVLIFLAGHAGETVAKEKIFSAVWNDTFVSDSALWRCISELRRVLEEDPSNPQLIITVPRRGYRFEGSVNCLKEDSPKSGLLPILHSSRARLAMGLGFFLCLIIAYVVFDSRGLSEESAGRPAASPNRSESGIADEVRDDRRDDEPSTALDLTMVLDDSIFSRKSSNGDFDISPDGDRIVFIGPYPLPGGSSPALATAENRTLSVSVYVTDRDYTRVQPLIRGWEDPSEIKKPPSFRNLSDLQWAPDGSFILFRAERAVSDNLQEAISGSPNSSQAATRTTYRSAFYIVDPIGGIARQLGRPFGLNEGLSIHSLGWTPDSLAVAYVDASDWTVRHRQLDGTDRVVTKLFLPPLTDPTRSHMTFAFGAYSPDGQWLIYCRRPTKDSAIWDLEVVSTTTGKPVEQMGPVRLDVVPHPTNRSIARPDWSANGDAIYFLDDATIWEVGFLRDRGRISDTRKQITFFRDGEIQEFRVAQRSGNLAFTLIFRHSQVVLAKSENPNEIINLGRGLDPLLSPDGNTVYFSGEGRDQQGIFAVSRDGRKLRRLTTLKAAGPLDLSPDGTTLAFVVEADGATIYTLSVATSRLRPLVSTSSDTKEVRWSPDGQELAFVGNNTLFAIESEGGTPTGLGQLHDWYYNYPLWSPDGSTLAAQGRERKDQEGTSIYLFEARGAGRRRLLANRQIDCLNWRPSGNRITFFDYSSSLTCEVDLAGKVTGPLFNHPGSWEYCGRWAPLDEPLFFFTGAFNGKWGLFTFDENTETFSEIKGFHTNVVGQSLPKWDAHGNRIVWNQVLEQRQLWLIDQKGEQAEGAPL